MKKDLLHLIGLVIFFSCNQFVHKPKDALPPKFNFHALPEIYLQFIPDSLKHLVPVFDTLLCGDQKYRQTNNMPLLVQNKKEQDTLDAVNIRLVDSLLSKYGFLGMKQFGYKGNLAIRMVLQHAPLKTQEKYLPTILKAFEDKIVIGDFVAMFTDRISMRENKFQKFGTQIIMYKGKYTLHPVANPDSLNAWRKGMGQIPIEAYLKMFKTDFNIEDYKKLMPELIKKMKIDTAQ